MNDQHLDAFLREARESITTLNNELLALEANPDDREQTDRLFREAHTLKGNFAALGFDGASDLAHAMEDLLDGVREGEIEATSDQVDLLFEGVDRIEAAIDELDDGGEPEVDADDLIEQLRERAAEGALESDTLDSTVGADGNSAGSDSNTSPSTAGAVGDGDLVRTDLTVDDGGLASADAMLALEAVEEAFGLADTEPDRETIENGDFEDGFAVIVDGDDPDEVRSHVAEQRNVSVADVTVVEGGGAGGKAGDGGESATGDGGDAADDDGDDESSLSMSGVDEIESVRVDVERLDELYRMVEQFVTAQVRLDRGVESEDLDSIEEIAGDIQKTTSMMQDTVIDMRLVPFGTIVGKFPRLVRDLSRQQDKDVDFEITGEEVELDRTILSELGDPLTHLLRNAVDHGIEPPEEREDAGKDPTGHLELRAERERDTVVVEVEDDGRGLDVEDIRDRAIERGLRSEEELDRMDRSEIYDLVLHPGFSTAEEVTDVSGRGVGMDVVHRTVTELDGTIDVRSEPGEGTTVRLELPVTMAIVRVLILRVGGEEYGVPMKHIDDITTREEIKELDGDHVLKHDGDLFPVVELAERFDVPGADAEGEGHLVRIDESARPIAIGCDEATTQQKVVVKPLEGLLRGTPGLSGTAILGDGDILHVLDIDTL